MNSALGSILLAVGGALQWVRQYRAIHDVWIAVIAVVLATGAWFLVADYSLPIRDQIIQLLSWLPGGVGAILGGTATAARMSYAVGAIPQANTK